MFEYVLKYTCWTYISMIKHTFIYIYMFTIILICYIIYRNFTFFSANQNVLPMLDMHWFPGRPDGRENRTQISWFHTQTYLREHGFWQCNVCKILIKYQLYVMYISKRKVRNQTQMDYTPLPPLMSVWIILTNSKFMLQANSKWSYRLLCPNSKTNNVFSWNHLLYRQIDTHK